MPRNVYGAVARGSPTHTCPGEDRGDCLLPSGELPETCGYKPRQAQLKKATAEIGTSAHTNRRDVRRQVTERGRTHTVRMSVERACCVRQSRQTLLWA